MSLRLAAIRAGVASLLLLLSSEVRATDVEPEAAQAEASMVVRGTVDQVLEIVRNPQLPAEQKQARTEQVVYERFDFETISRLVLARNWRKLSVEQRDAFAVEFRRHLSRTYGESLQDYHDEKITIERSRLERNGDVTVRTHIVGAAADPIVIDYRLRNKNRGWYVIDVIIESVSLISNFRTQTREIIGNVGADGLIKRLREKNDRASPDR